MKYILLLTLFLVACSVPIYSNQNVVEINQEKNISANTTVVANISANKTVVLPPVQEVTPIPVKKIPMTLSNTDEDHVYSVNNSVHIIEVIDVTANSDGCLIRVDDKTTLINKDSDQRINGVKIYVLDVRAFRSQLQDKDTCEVIIS